MERRAFLQTSVASGVTLWLGRDLTGCSTAAVRTSGPAPASSYVTPPARRPGNWDPVDYNLQRGAAGFISESYMGKIRDVDGIAKHLGKHLPYVVKAPERLEPGLLPLAWGDPSKGHAKHPNAPRSADNPEGHWYDWIRIAPEGEPAEEVITRFDNWPNTTTGLLLGMDGGDPADDSGKNTVYIPRRPVSTKSGDWVRIWAHCLTHGEYVDFVQIP